MSRHPQESPRPAQRRSVAILLGVLSLGAVALALALLSACGSSAPSGTIIRPTTNPSTSSAPTAGVGTPPAQSSYSYLYSRVDYPLQLPVGGVDTVTLTVSTHSSILTVAPSPGAGTTTVGAPISLPTDLQDYNDIGVTVDTIPNGASPLAWQLVSAPRQTLLSDPASNPRLYLDSVTFQWQVQAVTAGQNTIDIELRVYYVYLDGSEHTGSIQISPSAIPMVAIAASPIDSFLASVKVPLASVSWIAGIIAIVRFIYGVVKAISDVTEPVKDAANVARTVHRQLTRPPSGRRQ